MSVSNGQIANQTTFNNAFLSRLVNTSAVGEILLNNTSNVNSGLQVTNLQEAINNIYQNSKLFVLLNNEGTVSWDGSQLSFSEDIVIYSKDQGITNTILASQSPISIGANETVFVTLSRYSSTNVTPFVSSTPTKGKDIFHLCTRVGTSLVFYDGTVLRTGKTAIIGEGSGGAGFVKVDLYNPISTAHPTGTSAIVDGVTLVNGHKILYTNLSSGNNRIYEVSGVGTSLVFTAVAEFPNGLDPEDGDSVRVKLGTAFKEQLSIFDGTNFKVNEVVRFFNGADYWELNSLVTSTLTDNTTGNVFNVTATGSEFIFVFYGITRNGLFKSGVLNIVQDNTSASVNSFDNELAGTLGVTFTADINTGNLRLRYTTTSTGNNATMKYFIIRFSNASGGPASIPNYTGYTGGSSGAGGANTQIQFNNAGALAGDSALTWDSTNNILNHSGVETVGLQTATLLDAASSQVTFSANATTYRYMIVEYSLERNGEYEVGRLLVTNNGTNASLTFDNANTVSLGVVFSAQISGANVQVLHTLTSTGFNANMKYTIRRWG